MEVPDLSSSTIWSLDDHVSIVDKVEVSIVWELRYDVEISFDVQTKLLVKFSFAWFSLPLISIDNVPLLVDLVLLVHHTNVSLFRINSSLNF
jgi:hypothetical protein